jgi:hypothetical protein
MKHKLFGILLAAGTLFAAPAFAWGHGGYGGHSAGAYRGGYSAGGYRSGYSSGRAYYGGGYRGGYRGYYRPYRRWVPSYRLSTPFCFAYPLDPRCVVQGYWDY